MAKHRLDALVAPTGNPAWPTDLVNGDHFTGVELHAGRGGRLSAASPCRWASPGACRSISRSSGGLERADADPARLCVRADNHAPEGAAIPSDARLTLLPRQWIFHPGSRTLQPGPAWPSTSTLASDPAARAGVVTGPAARALLLDAPDPVARGAAGQPVPPDQGRRRAVPLAGPGGLRRRLAPTRSAGRTCSRRSSATSARCW